VSWNNLIRHVGFVVFLFDCHHKDSHPNVGTYWEKFSALISWPYNLFLTESIALFVPSAVASSGARLGWFQVDDTISKSSNSTRIAPDFWNRMLWDDEWVPVPELSSEILTGVVVKCRSVFWWCKMIYCRPTCHQPELQHTWGFSAFKFVPFFDSTASQISRRPVFPSRIRLSWHHLFFKDRLWFQSPVWNIRGIRRNSW